MHDTHNDVVSDDGRVFTYGMEFVKISPGRFLMGSPESEQGRQPSEKRHNVIVAKRFYLAETTVTVKLWRKFAKETGYKTEAEMADGSWKLVESKHWRWQKILPKYDWIMAEDCVWNNPGFVQDENHPVTCVFWNDVQHFVDWLNVDVEFSYRLPSESEWEYACRAGSTELYFFGQRISRAQGNIHRPLMGAYRRYPCLSFLHKNKRTTPVKYHTANKWGLISMHGNVWEWCQDGSGEIAEIPKTYKENIKDPLCSDGVNRVLRGGSWAYSKTFCRSANRRIELPDYRASGIGFRLALTVEE